jgi:hypothetical protein
VWDDHETQNDAGPHNQTLPDAPSEPRLAPARAAYVDYQPIVDAERLYRSARWGRHLEVFFLDTRSYRDANADPDTGAYPKTMLGEAQRRWLIGGLVRSKATWKVVVSSVPLSIPTGGDGWADGGTRQGFERSSSRSSPASAPCTSESRLAHDRRPLRDRLPLGAVSGLPHARAHERSVERRIFPAPDVDPTLHPSGSTSTVRRSP